MMRHFHFAFFLILFSAPSLAQQVNLSQEVKMLALGDSYTIGQSVEINGRWPHQLIDRLRSMGLKGDDPDYIATTGWTTGNLIQGINSRLDTGKSYNLVSILIGVNNQYQGAFIDFYEPDLRKIIDIALDVLNQDTSRILILSIPDYAYTPFGGGSERISLEIDEYNEIKKRVAAEYQIAFVNITNISRDGLSNPSLVALDGLHPSKLQYKIWVDSIIPQLQFELAMTNYSTEQIMDEPILVYPNPAGSIVKVESWEKIRRISVFNDAGRIVSDQTISTIPVEIDVSQLEPGLYVIWIYRAEEDSIIRRKLIVQ